jgi:hypothetical protein
MLYGRQRLYVVGRCGHVEHLSDGAAHSSMRYGQVGGSYVRDFNLINWRFLWGTTAEAG